MIDLHTHLLFNTDDGVEDIEQSIFQIQEAKRAGINTICLTPHYIEPDYMKSKIQNKKKLDKIKMELKKRNIDIKLYLGNEIYISENIDNILKEGIVSSVAESDYILVELPINAELKNYEELIYRIISNDKKVIIAHPERYIYYQKNKKYFENLTNTGKVYLQGNFGSIIGIYGKEAQKTIVRSIKEKRLHILASDIHKKNLYNKMPQIMLKLKKIADEKYINLLTQEIPSKIINNEEINIEKKIVSRFKIIKILKK